MTQPKTTPSNLPAVLLSKDGRCLRLPLTQLPSEHAVVKKMVNGLRRLLEDECVARHGSITGSKAALIQTACRFEQMTKLIERIMKKNWDTLDPNDQASLIDRIGKYSTQRDAAIGKLDIDVATKTGPDWNVIDQKQVTE